MRRSWQSWDVHGPGGPVRRASRRLRYQTVGAGAFYARAQSLLGDQSRAELSLGTTARDATKTAHGWRIDTDAGTLERAARHRHAPAAAQTRLRAVLSGPRNPHRAAGLRPRHRAADAVQTRAQHGIDFVYILPYARDLALVEVTSFAPCAPERDVFDTWLREEIAALAAGHHEVLREERGALPMEVGYHDPAPQGCIRMGLGGGAARPSTGYAFTRIQRQADLVTRALVHGDAIPASLDGPFARFMDRVFLQVIQTVPERGPALFESLFRNASRDRLEQFLSGSVHPLDRLSVMASLPTLPFLRAAMFPA